MGSFYTFPTTDMRAERHEKRTKGSKPSEAKGSAADQEQKDEEGAVKDIEALMMSWQVENTSLRSEALTQAVLREPGLPAGRSF